MEYENKIINELLEQVEDLKAERDSLKCCGNCRYMDWSEAIEWFECEKMDDIPNPWDKACKHWVKNNG